MYRESVYTLCLYNEREVGNNNTMFSNFFVRNLYPQYAERRDREDKHCAGLESKAVPRRSRRGAGERRDTSGREISSVPSGAGTEGAGGGTARGV